MKISIAGLLGFGLAVASLSTQAQAITVLNENFNALPLAFATTNVGAFQATVGNVDIVGSNYPYCVAPESGNCVDLQGSNDNAPNGGGVTVLQTTRAVTLMPGVDYYLSFDLIGSQRNLDSIPSDAVTTSTTVAFGSYDQTFVLGATDDTSGIVTNQLVTVSSPTAAYLTFVDTSPNGAIGALLDNVTITRSIRATAAPEIDPGSMTSALTLLLGALAVTMDRRGPLKA